MLNGGNEIEFYRCLALGERCVAQARYANVQLKEGRSGTMLMVDIETEFRTEAGDLLPTTSTGSASGSGILIAPSAGGTNAVITNTIVTRNVQAGIAVQPTGSGKANKEQVQLAIQRELGLKKVLEPHDVADAFAIALCHYHSTKHKLRAS